MSLPDPDDEPATVTAALRRTGRVAALLGEEHRAVRRSTADLATGWSGADADAAAVELSTLAGLLRTGAAALTTAASALGEYRAALELARTALGPVRGEYDETVQERDLRVQRGLTGLSHGAAPEQRAAVAEDLGRPDEAHLHRLIGRFEAIGNDVQAAARRLAGALATANQSLHLSGAPTPLAVTQRFATTRRRGEQVPFRTSWRRRSGPSGERTACRNCSPRWRPTRAGRTFPPSPPHS